MDATNRQRGGPRPVAPALGTTGGSPTRRSTGVGPRSRATMVGGLALGLTSAALAGLPAQAIDSNPPTGPGNIEIFPKRDMVAIDGYGEYAGKKAEITVLRDGAVVGSAIGTVDGTGFLEVNHPGGECWGAGTDLKVTPDIEGGDEIRVEFLGTGTPDKWDGATTTDVEITDVDRVDEGNRLVISGRYGAGVDMPGTDGVTDPGKVGVEIVNPDMRGGTSAVGERAIGWPLEAGEPLPTGYSVSGGVTSGTDEDGGTFAVTFAFDQATDLDLAEAGEVVALGWQAEAPPELGVEAFFGMTLYEFHEASGPGMGGCPAGPDEMAPDSPGTYSAEGVGAGVVEVRWDAAIAAPAAPAVTGYSVRAVNGEDEVGKRVDATARTTTLTGLTPGELYDIEIAARSSAGESWTPSTVRVRASDNPTPDATASTLRPPNGDGTYAPLITTANADFGVFLDPVPDVLGAEIYYTTNGATPTVDSPRFEPATETDAGTPSIQIRQDTTVKWLVVDSGNITGHGQRLFDIAEAAAATPPVISGAAPAPIDGAIDVTFGVIPDVTTYRVTTYTADGSVRVGNPVNVVVSDPAATSLTRRVVGLVNGTGYRFSVAGRVGTLWTAESAQFGPVAPQASPKAVVAANGPTLRGRTVTLDGSASVGAVGYQWLQVRPRATTGYQDPAVVLTGATTAKPTFRFPVLTTRTSDDGELAFRLTITLADGTTKVASTTVKAQADTVTVEENRWRAGDEIEGVGSQEGANLTILNGSATGPYIGTAVVGTGGAWEYPAGTPAAIGGKLYLWSDYGYAGTITVTS